MAKINERWRLTYSQSNDDGENLMDIDLSFENVSDEVLGQRIKTFLTAAGRVAIIDTSEQ